MTDPLREIAEQLANEWWFRLEDSPVTLADQLVRAMRLRDHVWQSCLIRYQIPTEREINDRMMVLLKAEAAK
jgi:hypothetical protein